MENKSERFQAPSFTSFGGDKGNEFKSDWPQKTELFKNSSNELVFEVKDESEAFEVLNDNNRLINEFKDLSALSKESNYPFEVTDYNDVENAIDNNWTGDVIWNNAEQRWIKEIK